MVLRQLTAGLFLASALVLGADVGRAYGAPYHGLTRSAVVRALNGFSLVSVRTVRDGHGGSLTAAEGISRANASLSRIIFWHGTTRLRTLNLYDSEITHYGPNKVTVRIGDLPSGMTGRYLYVYFYWSGSRLTATRPIPRQTPVSPPAQTPTASQPGFLGIDMETPPSDWSVTGCEVAHVIPGTAASLAGLVGAEDRVDPVGDVIYGLLLGGSYVPVTTCFDLTIALSATQPGEAVQIYFYHRVAGLLVGSWVNENTIAFLGVQPCPPPITGSITSQLFGNRIDLSIELVGAYATSQPITAMFDTGGVNTYLPNELLQQLGFTPFASTVGGGVVPGATDTEYLYQVPASDLLVQDGGSYVPLASGELLVIGIPGLQFAGVGPDILTHGATFSTSGSLWSLVPACTY